MKQLAVIFLTIALALPLYAQEGEEIAERNAFSTFSRQHFEFGIDAGVGFDNDLMGMDDIFVRDLVIDLDKLKISSNGFNLNLGVLTNLFINVRMAENWGFGFYTGVDGGIYANIPRSFLTFFRDGNINRPEFSSKISASGGVFANVGLTGFYKMQLFGGNWRFGVNPAVYAPVVYIPATSGIRVDLVTTADELSLGTDGAINVYSLFSFDPDNSGGLEIPLGFDLSLDAEYDLFPFLGLGARLSSIPIAASTMKYQMENKLKFEIIGSNLLNTESDPENPGGITVNEPEIVQNYYDDASFKVYRPLRFDVYAMFQPLLLIWADFANPELLTVRPNLGFTADITGGKGYFNAGLEIQTSLLNNMIFAYLGTGITENIWKHRLGLAVNLRAFELDLEGSLRSQDFAMSFQNAGYGVNVGLRFGW